MDGSRRANCKASSMPRCFAVEAEHRRLSDIGAEAGEWLLRPSRPGRTRRVSTAMKCRYSLFVVAQCVAQLTVAAGRFPPVQQLLFQFLEILGLTVFLTGFRIPAIFLKLM